MKLARLNTARRRRWTRLTHFFMLLSNALTIAITSEWSDNRGGSMVRQQSWVDEWSSTVDDGQTALEIRPTDGCYRGSAA